MKIKELLKVDVQFDKKISNRIILSGIVLLLLGFIGFFISLDGRSMRRGVALLYRDTSIASLYKYYPILLIVSLVLIMLGAILLWIKFMNVRKFRQAIYEAPQAVIPQVAATLQAERMPQAETVAMPQAELMPQEEVISQEEVIPQTEVLPQTDVVCNNCQQINKPDSKFCVACGHQIN